MEFVFLTIGLLTVATCGSIVWHLLVDDDCPHPNVGQYGECQDCGATIEIGGSE